MDDMVIAPGTDKVTSTVFIDHFIWDVFFKAWLSLPAKDQSIYNPKDVEYGAYDVSELREILKNYAGNSSVSYFNYNAIPCPQPTDFMNDEESQIARLRNFWKELLLSSLLKPLIIPFLFRLGLMLGWAVNLLFVELK